MTASTSNSVSDVAIIGCGTAGSFALQRLLKSNKNLKISVFEYGRFFAKRRHTLFGALGAMLNSDGKLYTNHLSSVTAVAGFAKTMKANQWVMDQWDAITPTKLIKDKRPSINLEKRLQKAGFELELNNHFQLFPREIHLFSRAVIAQLESHNNTVCSFDNEVFRVFKHKHHFTILTNDGEFQTRKVLIAVGRGGWRWASELFNNFGIIDNNDIAKFGIRAEIPSFCMRDFNQSNCTLTQNLIQVGPLSWQGTCVPEDHLDLVITSFRSNESRWLSDKVSFNIITEKHYPDNAYQCVDRIGKLSFILGNDRMIKEKISALMNHKSRLSVLSEYEFLLPFFEEFKQIVPDIINRGVFYAPTLLPNPPSIKLTKNFMSEVDGMYVVGEAANVQGLLGAMVSGTIAADAMTKG